METPQFSRHHSRRSSIGVDEAPFHAPLLSFDQIAIDLQATGFADVTADDLQATRKEKIRSVYAFLLETCAGVTDEELEKRATVYRLKCQDYYKYDFAETLHTNFMDFLFFLELRSIVVSSGYEQFSMRDIHTPTPKRLRVILSNLINFCKYREQQIPVYADLMKMRSKITDHYENMLEEKQGLLEQRDIAMEEAVQRLAEVEDLAKRCAEMEQLYMEMNSQQSNDRKMGNEAKKAAEEIKDKIETARWEVENILETKSRLEATALVHSPERKIKLCEERKRALEVVKKEHMEILVQIETVSARIHKLQSYQQPLEEMQDLVSQFANVQEKIRVSKAEDLEIQGKIRDVDKQYLEVKNTIEQEERTLARLQYQLEHGSNKDEIHEDEYRRKRTEALEKEALAKQRYQELERAYNEMIAKQQAEMQEMDKLEKELVDAYCERLDIVCAAFKKAEGSS